MATTKEFDIENPTTEMLAALQASAPAEDGFHVTKLSARDSKVFIEMLDGNSEPSEEVKATLVRARERYERLIGNPPR